MAAGGALIARIVLSGIFALAGATKLVDHSGFENSLLQFGVPERLIPELRYVIPGLEIVVAVGLLVDPAARFAAAGGLLLLLVFTAAISITLASGRHPSCHCFGTIGVEHVGVRSIVRNGILALVTILVIVVGQGLRLESFVVTAATSAITLSYAAVVAVLVEAFLLIAIVQQQGRLLVRLEQLEAAKRLTGLPVGATAPEFSLPDANGDMRSLRSFIDTRRALFVIFASASCRPCTSVVAQAAEWQQQLEDHLTVLVISSGTLAANESLLAHLPPSRLLLQTDTEMISAYQSPGTPSAVLIGPAGTIASRIAVGVVEIRALAALILGQDAVQMTVAVAAT